MHEVLLLEAQEYRTLKQYTHLVITSHYFHVHEVLTTNFQVPTAIGAVIGGLVGREVEKKVYEHKDEKRKREHEERY
jgi:S-adenosylmethionine:tRNA-ribosyltransferase-isomerase (queuine synthetase)